LRPPRWWGLDELSWRREHIGIRRWTATPWLQPQNRGADALILDLEDAVAPTGKDRARELVSAFLHDPPIGPASWVRVNA
jgi:hypothetical protein